MSSINGKLNIIAVEPNPQKNSAPKRRREEAKEKWGQMWKTDPEQFNPERNCMERERISRTWDLILKHFSPEGKQVADLGCGRGILAVKLCEKGASVHAVDIADYPLHQLDQKHIRNLTTSQDYVPRTILRDDFYDLVISTDMIAYLPPDEYRLYFSELSRLIKLSGFVVCSTPIDLCSEDALQRFANFAETEFKIEQWVFSYHRLYIGLLNLLKAPSRFAKAYSNPDYKTSALNQRRGLTRWWFEVNSTAIPAAIWSVVAVILKPIVHKIEQNHTILNFLEKITKLFWTDSGISHAIFLGSRRPLVIEPSSPPPTERRGRKQVWE